MTKQDLLEVVKYHIDNSQDWPSLALGGFAFIMSGVALGLSISKYKKRQQEIKNTYLKELRNAESNMGADCETFLDIRKTKAYKSEICGKQGHRYHEYCLNVWQCVLEIISRGYHKDPDFKNIIRSICSRHSEWLDYNLKGFLNLESTQVITMLRKNPCPTYRGQKVPVKGRDIDWDKVAPQYHRYILGPFAKEMVDKDREGRTRNELLNYLNSIPREKLKGMEIADFGCGPGNIIRYLKGRVSRLTGIDKSETALKKASTSARKNGIAFTACRDDLKKVKLNQQFDLIISVNSILPKERKDVVPILEGIREHLESDGELLAILPSYDTTKYLRKLLKKYYVRLYKDKRKAEETLRTFAKMKKVDDTKCAYADDGKIQQCYHTPKTIKHEFKKAGLKIIGEPKKVYYPWDLVRKFDYGYFPEAKEEIWDWFVVAKRAEKS